MINFFKKLFCKNKGVYDETDTTPIETPAVNMQQSQPVKPFEGLQPVGSEHVVFNEQSVSVASTAKVSEEGIADTKDEAEQLDANDSAPQGDFEKLLSEQAQLAKNYDQLAAQLEGDSRELLLDVVDSLILSGCKPNADEPSYDMSRHRPEPFSLAAPGTPIQRTIRQGVEWQGQVYIPAVVEL